MFRPFTLQINCSSDLKKKSQRRSEQFWKQNTISFHSWITEQKFPLICVQSRASKSIMMIRISFLDRHGTKHFQFVLFPFYMQRGEVEEMLTWVIGACRFVFHKGLPCRFVFHKGLPRRYFFHIFFNTHQYNPCEHFSNLLESGAILKSWLTFVPSSFWSNISLPGLKFPKVWYLHLQFTKILSSNKIVYVDIKKVDIGTLFRKLFWPTVIENFFWNSRLNAKNFDRKLRSPEQYIH